MKTIKYMLREILIYLHLDLTKNLKYDRLTKTIMRRYLKENDNCIDAGCHKGDVLHLMLKLSPGGKHYAFEPVPYLFRALLRKYHRRAQIFPYALSDTNGETVFQLVKNAPAYSGIRKRRYDIENPVIEEITVAMKTLDSVLSADESIQFMKIDVEGGEFGVLRGARNLLIQHKPLVLFECGKGASDYYGTKAAELFTFMTTEVGLEMYTLEAYIRGQAPMNATTFERYFETNEEYYFVAANRKI
jgi:FkbM family methyltransferase